MNRAHPGRRIRNFLIDARLQLHYVLQMVAVSAALTAGLGALVYRFNAEASRVMETSALDDDTARMIHDQYLQGQMKLVVALTLFGLVLCVVLAAWQVVTTHKIAGPLYYIKREMKKLGDGRIGKLHPLRKGDMLQDFFEVFAAMHESLRQKNAREAELFGKLAAEAEAQSPKNASLAEQLRALQAEREKATR